LPFVVSTGVYTAEPGATDAVPGEVIRSATWNTIFSDLSTALTQIGQSQVPTIQNQQASLGQTIITLLRRGVNFNAATTDTSIPVLLPSGFTYYFANAARIINTGSTPTLTTATCGVFTSPGGAGSTIVAAGTSITITSNTPNVVNNAQQLTIINGTSEYYSSGTLYFRVQTPQGTVATANVLLQIIPVS
jgi:hypothetical protein